MIFAIIFILGYLIGSVPFGFLIGKYYNIDIRKVGSGNIGATNVTRSVGKKAGKLCFFLDFIKGFVPVFLTVLFYKENNFLPLIAGVATIIGHIFPIYLKFKGGKGISTAGGVVCALSPLTFAITLVTWGLVFVVSRYVSLASIVASAVLAISSTIIYFTMENSISIPVLVLFYIAGILGIIRHKDNIKRLIDGTESRFERKKK